MFLKMKPAHDDVYIEKRITNQSINESVKPISIIIHNQVGNKAKGNSQP
jgi:hypothetical protein